jgi:hypothetical protein
VGEGDTPGEEGERTAGVIDAHPLCKTAPHKAARTNILCMTSLSF